VQATGRALILRWLRANPLAGRLVVKLAVALPMGLAAGLVLAWVCDALGLTRNIAAVGAALAALAGSARVSPRLAQRLGIPEIEG
jgi:hypothetical protein